METVKVLYANKSVSDNYKGNIVVYEYGQASLDDKKLDWIPVFEMNVPSELIHNKKFSTRNNLRNPDIEISFGDMKVYLESDGKVHGDLENPTDNTVKRNIDFENAKMTYILINHDHVNMLKKILHLVANDDDLIRFLAAYRVCEEFSKHKAKTIGHIS